LKDILARIEQLHANREYEEESKLLQQLLIDHPNDWRPYYGHGTLYAETGSDDAVALVLLNKAVELSKGQAPEPLNALATMHRRLENIGQAKFYYEKALALSPNEPIILTGMAGVHVNQGNPKEGIKWAKKALDVPNPNALHAINSLSLMLLEDGQWEDGFRLYRERAGLPRYDVRNYGDTPRWDGKPIPSLILHAEQGLGDEIMFASVIPEIKPMVEDLRLECAPRLIKLFERSFGIPCYGTHKEVWESGFRPAAWDRLADVFGSNRPTPHSCPGTPYLKADPVLVESYRARLKAVGEGPYCGLAWLGGTRETHARARRAPKELWLDLRQSLPGTAVSLQYGPEGAEDARAWGLPHWQASIDDMDEFAALVAALDLVICSPQTVTHFAGALGKDCWVASPSRGSWPFMASEETMMAYHAVKLYWQPKDDWTPVFGRMKRALEMDRAA